MLLVFISGNVLETQSIQCLSNIQYLEYLKGMGTVRQISWAKMPWNGVSSLHTTVGVLLDQVMMHKSGKVSRSNTLFKKGVSWELSKFPKHRVPEKHSEDLFCRIFDFREEGLNCFYSRYGALNHNRRSVGWHFIKFLLTFQISIPTVFIVYESR